MNFADAVEAEVNRARGLHKPLNSAHEAYSVILEEVDEFWDEVKKKRSERNPQNMLVELIQIGAMAQRAAEDLKLTMRTDAAIFEVAAMARDIGRCGPEESLHHNGSGG